MGFHPTWIDFRMHIISLLFTHCYGEPKGFIKPPGGLRQGDPISLCRFILCMKVFNLILFKEANPRKSRIGVKISPQGTKIPCLLFADNSLLFCKANTNSCSKLKSILDSFCSMSCQLVNLH